MKTIDVHTASIIINDYEQGDCPKLENCFKMYDMITHTYFYIGMIYNKDKKQLILPRGIDLWWVQSNFPDYKLNFIEPEEFAYFEKDVKMKYGPRDDRQKEALRFMLGINEYSRNKDFSQLMINLNTGAGKTFTSVYTMAYEKIKSIVITYSNGWLKQWKDCIMEYTDMEENRIHQIKGAEAINMLLSGRSKYQNCDIFLVTHSTLKSYGDTYGWDKITKLFKLLKIGMSFIDEAHLNFTNICDISAYTNIYKTYYITATPARSNENENRIYQLSMKNIPKIELFDENNDPHTDYIAIKWSSKPTPQQISDCRNAYGLDRNKYTNYVVNQPEFYKMLHIILNMALKHKGKCLFYIGTNEAIIKVYNWISENYPEYIGDIGIYTSLTSETKAEEKNKKIILSTTKSAGVMATQHIQ